MAGFCELAIGLRAPKLAAAEAKSPIVSGGYLKYSRFWETATGDRVRSTLRDGPPVREQPAFGLSRFCSRDESADAAPDILAPSVKFRSSAATSTAAISSANSGIDLTATRSANSDASGLATSFARLATAARHENKRPDPLGKPRTHTRECAGQERV